MAAVLLFRLTRPQSSSRGKGRCAKACWEGRKRERKTTGKSCVEKLFYESKSCAKSYSIVFSPDIAFFLLSGYLNAIFWSIWP